jgi:hypothetical protein
VNISGSEQVVDHVRLIERFTRAQRSGEVLVDGRGVGEWDAAWLKHFIARDEPFTGTQRARLFIVLSLNGLAGSSGGAVS